MEQQTTPGGAPDNSPTQQNAVHVQQASSTMQSTTVGQLSHVSTPNDDPQSVGPSLSSLSKADIIRLLVNIEGQLQGQEIALAALRLEKLRPILHGQRYALNLIRDPVAALSRDARTLASMYAEKQTSATSASAAGGDSAITAEAQLTTQLERLDLVDYDVKQRAGCLVHYLNLVVHSFERESAHREACLQNAEKKLAEVANELDAERKRHRRGVVGEDDGEGPLADQERVIIEALRFELDSERQKVRQLENDHQALSKKTAEQQALIAKQKQLVIFLIQQRNGLMEMLKKLQEDDNSHANNNNNYNRSSGGTVRQSDEGGGKRSSGASTIMSTGTSAEEQLHLSEQTLTQQAATIKRLQRADDDNKAEIDNLNGQIRLLNAQLESLTAGDAPTSSPRSPVGAHHHYNYPPPPPPITASGSPSHQHILDQLASSSSTSPRSLSRQPLSPPYSTPPSTATTNRPQSPITSNTSVAIGTNLISPTFSTSPATGSLTTLRRASQPPSHSSSASSVIERHRGSSLSTSCPSPPPPVPSTMSRQPVSDVSVQKALAQLTAGASVGYTSAHITPNDPQQQQLPASILKSSSTSGGPGSTATVVRSSHPYRSASLTASAQQLAHPPGKQQQQMNSGANSSSDVSTSSSSSLATTTSLFSTIVPQKSATITPIGVRSTYNPPHIDVDSGSNGAMRPDSPPPPPPPPPHPPPMQPSAYERTTDSSGSPPLNKMSPFSAGSTSSAASGRNINVQQGQTAIFTTPSGSHIKLQVAAGSAGPDGGGAGGGSGGVKLQIGPPPSQIRQQHPQQQQHVSSAAINNGPTMSGVGATGLMMPIATASNPAAAHIPLQIRPRSAPHGAVQARSSVGGGTSAGPFVQLPTTPSHSQQQQHTLTMPGGSSTSSQSPSQNQQLLLGHPPQSATRMSSNR